MGFLSKNVRYREGSELTVLCTWNDRVACSCSMANATEKTHKKCEYVPDPHHCLITSIFFFDTLSLIISFPECFPLEFPSHTSFIHSFSISHCIFIVSICNQSHINVSSFRCVQAPLVPTRERKMSIQKETQTYDVRLHYNSHTYAIRSHLTVSTFIQHPQRS